MNNITPFLIFSVFQTTQDMTTNVKNHEVLIDELQDAGIYFKEVKGAYKGTHEISILIEAKHETLVRVLTKRENQESYLYVDSNGLASLHKPVTGDTIAVVGRWREVSGNNDSENYTCIDGRYFEAS